MRRPAALALTLLASLFLLRVVGQALVAFGGVTSLPPMPEWYSGLLPYPTLLPAQVVILAVQGWVSLPRGRAWLATRRDR